MRHSLWLFVVVVAVFGTALGAENEAVELSAEEAAVEPSMGEEAAEPVADEKLVEPAADLRQLLAPELGEGFLYEDDPKLRDPFKSPLTMRHPDVDITDPSRGELDLPSPEVGDLQRDVEIVEDAEGLVRNMEEKIQGDESALIEVVELYGQLQALHVNDEELATKLEELQARGNELASQASERVFEQMWTKAQGLLTEMRQRLKKEDLDGVEGSFGQLETLVAGMSFDEEMKAKFDVLRVDGQAIVQQAEDIQEFRKDVEPAINVSAFVRLEDRACVIVNGRVREPGEMVPGQDALEIVSVTETSIVFRYKSADVTMSYGIAGTH